MENAWSNRSNSTQNSFQYFMFCMHVWRLLLHVSPTYNVLRHMYIVLPDDLAKGKRLVGGIVPVVTVVVVDPVVIVVAGVV